MVKLPNVASSIDLRLLIGRSHLTSMASTVLRQHIHLQVYRIFVQQIIWRIIHCMDHRSLEHPSKLEFYRLRGPLLVRKREQYLVLVVLSLKMWCNYPLGEVIRGLKTRLESSIST